MTKKPFLENTIDELFEWCSVIIDQARDFAQRNEAAGDTYSDQRQTIETAKKSDDLRGLRIVSVDLFHATSGQDPALIARINEELERRFGPDTAFIPYHHELD